MVWPEEIDRKVLLDHFGFAQIVVNRDAGIVDQDVEGLDPGCRSLDLRCVSHLQRHRRHPSIGMLPWRACPGIDGFRASFERLVNQRLANATISAGD